MKQHKAYHFSGDETPPFFGRWLRSRKVDDQSSELNLNLEAKEWFSSFIASEFKLELIHFETAMPGGWSVLVGGSLVDVERYVTASHQYERDYFRENFGQELKSDNFALRYESISVEPHSEMVKHILRMLG